MSRSFSIIGSLDRIHAACLCKKLIFHDSTILHPECTIMVTMDTRTTFTMEGDRLTAEKLIRDIAVLALDQPYYPVTMEELDK
jgi:hypothetical protein